MIFSSLKLCNIGLYKGNNYLSLYPKNNKNIILFGGKNGAGKTTILEAIKLCLYGNNIYEFSKNEYKNFIKKIIHRGESFGSIELEFVFFLEGMEERYRVLREFDISNGVKEKFILYKNEKVIKDIPKEYWQEFIFDIIPPGLVNFFFFDGEKIEKLADDLTETEFINDIKNLIGVYLIDDLNTSLGVLQRKYLKESNLPLSIISKIETLEKEKIKIENELQKYNQEKASINQKIQVISKELKEVEKDFYKKGGKLFKDYEKLKAKREILINKIENIKLEIKNLSSLELPLAIGLDLLEELIKQLEVEEKIKKATFTKRILGEKYQELIQILKDIDLPKRKIKELEKLFLSLKIPSGDIIHNLSEEDIYKIKNIYITLKKYTIPRAKKLFKNLELLEENLAQIDFTLQSIPKKDVLAPYLKKIRDLEKQKFKLKVDFENISREIKKYEEKKKVIDKEISKLEKSIQQHHKNKKVLDLIQKSQNVLQKFKGKFIKRKISILKKEILDALSKLERKGNFIVDLDINPETFEIVLYDRNNNIIPFDRLSAGERQIFAISFLWGLAKTSGKSLPVIIDTPLGRLDSEHRNNLAKNYFPNISHQVILLSTDTEINEDLYNLMKEHISHSYHLVYDNSCMCTKIKEGYFFNQLQLFEVKNEV